MASGPGGAGADWLSEQQREAVERAASLPLPTRKTKRWEFTDLGDFSFEDYAPAGPGDAGALQRADSYLPPVEGALRVDQVDGSSVAEPEAPGGSDERPTEPVVVSLATAAARWPELVRSHLGAVVDGSDDPIAARNDAAWRGGAFVYVPAGQKLEVPAQLTAVQDAEGSQLNWRTLIVVEEGAEAEVWERYLSATEELDALFNSTVEISVGQGANLRFVSGQHLSESSWIFGSQRAVVEREGSLDWVALGLGSRRGKVRMETKLAGRGASAKVTGAYAASGSQHLDFDTNQEHAAPDTTSDLAFRGILDEEATSVWWGMIVVDRGAQRTDAFQESRNLLISRDAHADAIPGLEIEADDVRCTHAAAIAQVDKEQLFYLRSRGLPEPAAKRLVIEGFLQALVERLAEGPVRDAVSSALDARLNEILGEIPEALAA